MGSSLRIFRIFNILVELHWTFVLFLLFLLFFIGFKSFLFFIIVFFFVLSHEICHSLVAKANGIAVERIVLTFFGGMANVDIPENPKLELKMASVGPAFNLSVFLLGFLAIKLLGLPLADYSQVLESPGVTALDVLYLIVYVNLMLGLFNIIPGFPMDGGRMLRSFLALRIDYLKATRLAVEVSHYLVFPLFVLVGLYTGNVFLVVIPLFLYMASSGELKFITLKRAFQGMAVGQVAKSDYVHVNSSLTVGEFLDRFAKPLERYYVVVDDAKRVIGVLDLRSLANTRSDVKIGDRIASDFQTIDHSVPLDRSLKRVLDSEFLLVVDGDKVKGYITGEIVAKTLFYYGLRGRKNGF